VRGTTHHRDHLPSPWCRKLDSRHCEWPGVAGVIGLRGPDIEKRDALRGYQVVFVDADRPYVRPHTGLPVLTMKEGKPDVHRHVFGFSRRFSSFNAREDKLAESKMWSGMFAKPGHHGVAPVSYILEWGDLGDGAGKRPFRIERADGAAMAVPALVGGYWEKKGEDAFALVTIEPNEFVARFHDRMIGQLDDDHIDVWLRPEDHTEDELRRCLVPPPDDELVAIPIKADAGSAKFDDADALGAVGPAVRWEQVRHLPTKSEREEADPAKGKVRKAARPRPATGRGTQKTLGGL
jgi:putative SOS response-associated peptidase YedK